MLLAGAAVLKVLAPLPLPLFLKMMEGLVLEVLEAKHCKKK
jgi:hypothetical protein